MASKYDWNRLLDPQIDSLEFPFEDAAKIRVNASLWAKRNKVKIVTHKRERPQGTVLEVSYIGDRDPD